MRLLILKSSTQGNISSKNKSLTIPKCTKWRNNLCLIQICGLLLTNGHTKSKNGLMDNGEKSVLNNAKNLFKTQLKISIIPYATLKIKKSFIFSKSHKVSSRKSNNSNQRFLYFQHSENKDSDPGIGK